MSGLGTIGHLQNKGCRRLGHDRRGFLPRRCMLEKRSGIDRRIDPGKRIGKDPLDIFEPKRKTDESVEFPSRSVRELLEAVCICLLLWGVMIISIDISFERITSIILTSVGSPR